MCLYLIFKCCCSLLIPKRSNECLPIPNCICMYAYHIHHTSASRFKQFIFFTFIFMYIFHSIFRICVFYSLLLLLVWLSASFPLHTLNSLLGLFGEFLCICFGLHLRTLNIVVHLLFGIEKNNYNCLARRNDRHTE